MTAADQAQDPTAPTDLVETADAAVRRLAAEVEQLRYERRLLGYTRLVLDLVAAGDESRWPQARAEAADMAQRIVDEIGHPITDEPALGPSLREQLASAEAASWRYAERLGALHREHAHCPTPAQLNEQQNRDSALDYATRLLARRNTPLTIEEIDWIAAVAPGLADGFAAYITTGEHPES